MWLGELVGAPKGIMLRQKLTQHSKVLHGTESLRMSNRGQGLARHLPPRQHKIGSKMSQNRGLPTRLHHGVPRPVLNALFRVPLPKELRHKEASPGIHVLNPRPSLRLITQF